MMCPACGSRSVRQKMVYINAPHRQIMWVCSECGAKW